MNLPVQNWKTDSPRYAYLMGRAYISLLRDKGYALIELKRGGTYRITTTSLVEACAAAEKALEVFC